MTHFTDKTRSSDAIQRGWVAGAMIAICGIVGGCHPEHSQSMLHPESGPAAAVALLWWFLFAVCGAVFFVVMLLTAMAVFKRPAEPQSEPPLGNGFIVIGGAVIPALILVVFLIVSVGVQVKLREPETDLTIRVTGHLWWWDIHYPDQRIRTANEIHVPVGRPVRLELTSADIIHSLWFPNLQGKTDLLPDKVNTTWIVADRPGVYHGQCAEYCGVQHALMRLRLVALPEEKFDTWIAQRQQAISEPRTELQQRGRAVFVEAKCNNCHVVAGVPNTGDRAPNLTHVGSRLTIGAGLLPNTRGNLAGWVVNPQALKPGNLMPVTPMPAEDLHALVEYLLSLQ